MLRVLACEFVVVSLLNVNVCVHYSATDSPAVDLIENNLWMMLINLDF